LTPGGPFATFLFGQNGVEISYSQGCDINDSVCLGGSCKALTYADMGSGTTGSVEVENGPSKVSPDMLLNVFWEIRDPTTLNRQGSNGSTEYRSAIIF
jgi:peptide methionine sulfoxide reductase MsrA